MTGATTNENTANLLADAEQGSSLWQDAWQRLKKNRMAVGGGAVLLFFVVVALLTPWLAPYAWTTKIATFMTWCFEIGAPLYWWFAHAQATADRPGRLRRWTNRLRLRECFVAFGLSMHIGIWVLMEVGPFSIASIAYYACLRRGKVSAAEDQ